MRSWWGEGVGFRIAFVVVVDIRHAVVAAVMGVACTGPLLGSRLVDTAPLRWGLLHCRVPCGITFSENVGCLVADKLPAVGIVAISGGFAAVPAIAVLVPLGVPVISAGGAMVVHSYYCSGAVPLFDELSAALGAVVAFASRLLLVLLGPRTPFETAVH